MRVVDHHGPGVEVGVLFAVTSRALGYEVLFAVGAASRDRDEVAYGHLAFDEYSTVETGLSPKEGYPFAVYLTGRSTRFAGFLI